MRKKMKKTPEMLKNVGCEIFALLIYFIVANFKNGAIN
jgi:hypothetical protein